MAYDPVNEGVLLFGNHPAFCLDGLCQDTWIYDDEGWRVLVRAGEGS